MPMAMVMPMASSVRTRKKKSITAPSTMSTP